MNAASAQHQVGFCWPCLALVAGEADAPEAEALPLTPPAPRPHWGTFNPLVWTGAMDVWAQDFGIFGPVFWMVGCEECGGGCGGQS